MLNIALIGRENVGKSSIFNRLSNKYQKSIIHSKPGVTVDLNISQIKHEEEFECSIIDTPGGINHYSKMQKNNLIDVFALVLDYERGILPEDEQIIELIYKSGKSFFVLVNKYDKKGSFTKEQYANYFKQEVLFVSAAHNTGIGQIKQIAKSIFYNKVKESQNSNQDLSKEITESIKIAILGKPNTGKSTFINAILKKERLKVSSEMGTTVDSIYIPFEYKNRNLFLIDTAGLRKKNKIKSQTLENLISSNTVNTISTADIVILMLDATEPISKQDWNIINLISRKNKSIILAFNKIDLLLKKEIESLKLIIEQGIKQITLCNYVLISAIKAKNLSKLLKSCITTYDAYENNIKTSNLNKWLKQAISNYPPHRTSKSKKLIKLKYCTKIQDKPIVIKIFCNFPDEIKSNYKSYLYKNFLKYFKLTSVALIMKFTKSNNPYVN